MSTNVNTEEIADLLFGQAPPLTNVVDAFAERALPANAMVTRFAPSPTGVLHIGGLFAAFVSKNLAQHSNGTFILRIEDTDKKREVPGSQAGLVDGLMRFGVTPDEGPGFSGAYGPYVQSERIPIYHAFAKDLVQRQCAYPDFRTLEELEELRVQQSQAGEKTGIYGRFSMVGAYSLNDVRSFLEANTPWVLRLVAPKYAGRDRFVDEVRGEIEIEGNNLDIVLIKQDGTPTYHFAHIVDDYLMRVTHVIRGDEWIASMPIHNQLHEAMEITPPRYIHLAPIEKIVGSTRRKLSKRKDPEADVAYYARAGYPRAAVIEYLVLIANSKFQSWRVGNVHSDAADYAISVSNLPNSGVLFDLEKLESLSKDIIAALPSENGFAQVVAWASEFHTPFATAIASQPERARALLQFICRGTFARRDVAKWSDLPEKYSFVFDPLFQTPDVGAFSPYPGADEVLRHAEVFLSIEDKATWLERSKDIALALGYALNKKTLRSDSIGLYSDFMTVLRLALTGRSNSPDLHDIAQILGREDAIKRVRHAEQQLRAHR